MMEKRWRNEAGSAVPGLVDVALEVVRNRVLLETLSRVQAGETPPLERLVALFPEYETIVKSELALASSACKEQENVRTLVSTRVSSGKSRIPPIERVGRYVIDAPLATGGMGIVYLATDEVLGRTVVLKTARKGLVREDVLLRLRREAVLGSRLDHPAICPVLDVVEDETHGLFIVQPFIAGRTLGGILEDSASVGKSLQFEFSAKTSCGWSGTRGGRRPAPLVDVDPMSSPPHPMSIDFIEFMERVARAVDYSHRENIIHRDLKPQNIMVRIDGAPVILDFGLAREIDGETMTEEGSTLGTPFYMAPEQVAPGDDLGPPTDVYALGVILYKGITGRVPFLAETRDALYYQIFEGKPCSPRRLNPAISKDLEAVCLKAMARDSRDRFRTAAEFAEELRRIRRNEPTLTRPPHFVERTWRFVGRRPWYSGLVAALLLLAVSLTYVIFQWKTSEERADQYRALLVKKASEGRAAFSDREMQIFRGLLPDARADESRSPQGASALSLDDREALAALFQDPFDPVTMRKLKRSMRVAGRRSGGRNDGGYLCRPRGAIAETRPAFVFPASWLQGIGKDENAFLQLTLGRPGSGRQARARRVPLDAVLAVSSSSGDELLSVSLPESLELEEGYYEWRIMSQSGEGRGRLLGPLQRFEVRSPEVLARVLPDVPDSMPRDLGLLLEAWALFDAGFLAASLKRLEAIDLEGRDRVTTAPRVAVLHHLIAEAFGDLGRVNDSDERIRGLKELYGTRPGGAEERR